METGRMDLIHAARFAYAGMGRNVPGNGGRIRLPVLERALSGHVEIGTDDGRADSSQRDDRMKQGVMGNGFSRCGGIFQRPDDVGVSFTVERTVPDQKGNVFLFRINGIRSPDGVKKSSVLAEQLSMIRDIYDHGVAVPQLVVESEKKVIGFDDRVVVGVDDVLSMIIQRFRRILVRNEYTEFIRIVMPVIEVRSGCMQQQQKPLIVFPEQGFRFVQHGLIRGRTEIFYVLRRADERVGKMSGPSESVLS